MEKTLIGYYVDLSFHDFTERLKETDINTGVMLTIYNMLQSCYFNLVSKKDILIERVVYVKGTEKEKDYDIVIKGIYVNLFKIEEKLIYLRNLIQDNLNKVIVS